ncbi:HD-GYP domain-containing protein [Anaerostipes sp.]|uniref:HD-GYP domain-containing protein n=1 Tax=Anaerostipes sp. TaxID=1872530 RepID=UPI0025C11AD5|nr:HD domain-containing phosphohydrolase [Anaerostipes sp.]MBS7008669.1 HD domain-containing protein [Anaerostipes sp.]
MLQYNTSFIDNKAVIGILRRACSHVDKRLIDHGIRVSYIVSCFLRDVPGIHSVKLRDLCFLAALHDIGAYKTEEIDRMVQFETENVWEHSVYGYLFIKYFTPLSSFAPAVLYHHTPWSELKEQDDISAELKYIAQLIYISDRLDIWMNSEHRSFSDFIRIISGERGTRFESSLVDALADMQFASFTAEQAERDPAFIHMQSEIAFSHEEILAYLKTIIYSMDFRSIHTVTHTITTTSISNELAELMRLTPAYRNQIVFGALLHDLGKIGIPVEILEYPGRLSPQAMAVMRTHVDITAEIFEDDIPETIQRIALRHHEKLDGSGYPRGLSAKDLTIGERIVAMADIVSALAGTRSYKKAYGRERIISIISEMSQSGLIDSGLVDLMTTNYDQIMGKTAVHCKPVMDIYRKLRREYTETYARCSAGRNIEKRKKL